MRPSDRRLKQNTIKIGDHPIGFGIYLFDYRAEFRGGCGLGRQFGVMADEVEAVLPEAVSEHPSGYKLVDYALLDISPRRTS